MTTTTDRTSRSTEWQLDPAHTSVEFAVRHLMIATVKGRFARLEGTLRLDDDDSTRSALDVEIDAASIDTRNADRDKHLRSADFFDVENHPTIRFTSRRVERTGDGRYRVTGDLTMRGITWEAVLDVEERGRIQDPWGNRRIAFSATGRVSRSEWGLKWNQALETGGVMVGDEVRISIDAQAVLAAGEQAA